MRLNFNVLWVEDQPDNVQSQKEKIERFIKEEGFRLQVIFASSVIEAKSYLSNDIYGDHIDLILMDYDLGPGTKGDEGIEEVRGIFPYKDIVFYSAHATELLSKVAARKVQGVFCSVRDDLPDTVDGVFEALVKKVLDIEHSRGIVMGATSDIDHYINECLTFGFEGCDKPRQLEILNVVKKHIKNKRKSLEKDLEKLEKITNLLGLSDFHSIYTSYDRLRLLKNMLKSEEIHQKITESIDVYLSDTVHKRNALAHVRVKVEGFSRKLYDREENELTSDHMRELRQDLLHYQDLFEELVVKLSSADSTED